MNTRHPQNIEDRHLANALLTRKYFAILALLVLVMSFPAQRTPLQSELHHYSAASGNADGCGYRHDLGLAGSIDLSVGSMVGLSALTAAIYANKIGVWAIFPAMLVGLMCGTVNGLIFAKGKVPSFMATLGGLVAYRGLVLLITRGAPVEIINMRFLNVYGAEQGTYLTR